ncbi:DsbA family protein [Mariniluteicoccus flavus]
MSKPKPAKQGSRRAELRAAQIAEAKRRKNQRTVFAIVGGLLALALIAGIAFAVIKFREAEAANIPPNATKDKGGIVMNPGKAKPGAPVVAIYQDYQCPACKQFEDRVGPQLEELANAGDIQLENHTMKFLDTNLRNDASERAANAAVCADAAGHYAAYHRTVYKNQPAQEGVGYTDDQLKKDFAQQAGITGDQAQSFESCFTSRKFKSYVNSMDVKAGEAGITGTPSVKVNGKVVETKNFVGDKTAVKAAIDAAAK